MKTRLSSVQMVIECRDYRVPLTSTNPLFEEALAGRERMVVYTKRDLGSNDTASDLQREQLLREWHRPSEVLFSDHKNPQDARGVLRALRSHSMESVSLTGSRVMVVGMPNIGKSSLLNSLRRAGVGRAGAASTGAQPGVTRKVATHVKILDDQEGATAVYLLDTPGVFIPYVPNSESMLKLALCGSVKDWIIEPVILADYLLYHLNKVSPALYAEYHPPTNDVIPFLHGIARSTGRLRKGGLTDLEGAAVWVIQRWRGGLLGHFVLDDVTEASLREHRNSRGTVSSFNQVKKAAKQAKMAKQKMRTDADIHD